MKYQKQGKFFSYYYITIKPLNSKGMNTPTGSGSGSISGSIKRQISSI